MNIVGTLLIAPPAVNAGTDRHTTEFERNLMFWMGLGILVAVPVFKTVTHLPPYVGILFGLGLLWLVGDIVDARCLDLFAGSGALVASVIGFPHGCEPGEVKARGAARRARSDWMKIEQQRGISVTSSVMTPLAPPVVPPRTAAVQQASMSPGVKTFLGLGLLFGAIWVFDQTQPPNKRIIKFP